MINSPMRYFHDRRLHRLISLILVSSADSIPLILLVVLLV